jgi:hypothetical protein
MTKEEKAKDKRLQKLYGTTLEDYNRRLGEQGGLCGICGLAPATRSLSVDHDHKWKYLKIKSNKSFVGSDAWIVGENIKPPYCSLVGHGSTEREARRDLKEKLKRASIRGLLCFQCNGGLRKFGDNPDRCFNAQLYLIKHQGGVGV